MNMVISGDCVTDRLNINLCVPKNKTYQKEKSKSIFIQMVYFITFATRHFGVFFIITRLIAPNHIRIVRFIAGDAYGHCLLLL